MKTVEYKHCPCGVKRGFATEELAEKALGRARAKRNRMADRQGTRRGMERENRFYECAAGMFHLTKQSKRDHLDVMAALQAQYASEIGYVELVAA